MYIEIELRVEEDGWNILSQLPALCQRALSAIGTIEPAVGTVSILLTDDEALRDLNCKFRGKDKPTDVLSFPAAEMDRPLLGDIAVALGVASRDADEQGKTLADHFMHLLIHGYLHLLGYDHETRQEAKRMEALEIKALASLGIANPYLQD